MIADQVAHIVAGDGARAPAVLRGPRARVVGVRHGLDDGLGRICAPALNLALSSQTPFDERGGVSGVNRFVIRSGPLRTA